MNRADPENMPTHSLPSLGLISCLLLGACVSSKQAPSKAPADALEQRLALIEAGAGESLIRDPEVAVRLRLARVAQNQDILGSLSTDPDPIVRARVADRFGAFPERLSRLRELCQDPSSVVRVVAAHSVCRIAKMQTGQPELLEIGETLARSPDSHLRWKAACILAWTPGAEETLRALAKDPDIDVKRESIRAIGKRRDPRDLDRLLQALQSPNTHVRRSAAEAIGESGDTRAIPHLDKALDDPCVLVTSAVARALHQLGQARRIPEFHPPPRPRNPAEMLRLASDPDPTVRKDLAASLACDLRGTTVLISLLTDPDDDVRKSAADSASCPGWPALPVLPLLGDPDPDIVVTVLEGIARIGEAPPEKLLPFLDHPDTEFLLRAAEALAALKQKEALRPFISHPDERVRAASASILPDTTSPGDPSVIVRREAARANPGRWRDDPDSLVRAAAGASGPRDEAWAESVLTEEDQLIALRYCWNDDKDHAGFKLDRKKGARRGFGHPSAW